MNNPLHTATICTLFYPLLGQTRIEDNITCAHWDSLSSKQKPKTQEKKERKGGREHRVQTWYSCIIPADEALWSITEITSMWYYDLLPQTSLVWLQSGIQLPLENIPATLVSSSRNENPRKPSPPISQTKRKKWWADVRKVYALKGKNRCRREEAKALAAWNQTLLNFLQHKLELIRTLWQAPNEDPSVNSSMSSTDFFLPKPGFLGEFIWIFSGRNHFKIQYLPYSESKSYQINSIKSCSSRSFQQHQRHISIPPKNSATIWITWPLNMQVTLLFIVLH